MLPDKKAPESYPGYPKVQGRCPSCGNASLFLGDGGYVTCAILGCAAPCAATDILLVGVVNREAVERAARALAREYGYEQELTGSPCVPGSTPYTATYWRELASRTLRAATVATSRTEAGT